MRPRMAAYHVRSLLEALEALETRLEASPEAIVDALETVQAEPSIPDDLIAEWPIPPERFV